MDPGGKPDADKNKNINLGVVFPIPAFVSVTEGRPRKRRSPVWEKRDGLDS